MRGRRQRDLILPIDSPVGVYGDGICVRRSNGTIDVQRVEVSRGPQGALFGRKSTAGAESFVAADPKSEPGGSAQVSVGNHSAVTVTGVPNVSITQNVGVRFVDQFPPSKVRGDFGDLKAMLSGDHAHSKGGGPISRVSGLTPMRRDRASGTSAHPERRTA